MANIVNLDRVTKGYDAVGALLTEMSIGVDDRDRVGVVGLNGAGKSTLLRLLARAEEPDSGRVTHRRDLRVSMLPQSLELARAATVGDVVLGDAWLPAQFAAEHEWAGSQEIRGILDGLGMPGLGGAGLDQMIGPMSGGERRRIALAALLVRPTDLLILDEPTNHLDIAGIKWLAEWLNNASCVQSNAQADRPWEAMTSKPDLGHSVDHGSRRGECSCRSCARGGSGNHRRAIRQRWRGALAVVTHDRWFLDAVCDHIWEVTDQQVRAYEGGFAAWTLARAERERVAAAVEARRQNLLRKEIAWLRRGPPARTAKPKFRIEAANALIADVPVPRDQVSLAKLATARLGRQVYDLEEVSLHAGPKLILDRVTWHVGPGDRIALLGANGAGKSTLLRMLATGHQPGLAVGKTVKPAFLSQELTELPGELRLLEAVEQVAQRVRLGDRDLSAAQLAEVFGFTDRRLWTPVADLSGGERRRLQLLRLLATEPNVLLLDEPTNDLDTDTLAALEDLLDSWPGTMIVASHDRYLVERVCDQVYALPGDGTLRHLPNGVDQYVAGFARAESNARAVPPGKPTSSLSPGAGNEESEMSGLRPATHDASPPAGGGTAIRAAELRQAKKDLVKVERSLEKLTQREEKLHAQLAEHATDFVKVAELDAQLSDLTASRAALEEEWLILADLLT